MQQRRQRLNRRRFLAAGTAAALAGCLGGGNGDGNGDTTGGSSDGDGTGGDDGDGTGGNDGDEMGGDDGAGSGNNGESGGRNVLGGHSAGMALDAQPKLGPDPSEATGVIVVFEDPSCPRCKRFEQQVVPKIRSNLVEPGDATFVFRGYPVIYEWGKPAARALEAVYDADPGTHFTLLEHYFDEQSAYESAGADAVYDRTETFLAEETDLDAAAVIDGARNGDYEDPVQTDLDAGREAGAGRTTPHVFLFRDGQFRTKGKGSISFDTIESVLQV